MAAPTRALLRADLVPLSQLTTDNSVNAIPVTLSQGLDSHETAMATIGHKATRHFPGQTWCIDLGMCPRPEGFTYIPAMKDEFSHFIMLAPLNQKTAQEDIPSPQWPTFSPTRWRDFTRPWVLSSGWGMRGQALTVPANFKVLELAYNSTEAITITLSQG
ncbi:MAG: hypothetical protein GY696_01890 [Gammaproteobacteria bacterium]|nr:hypothetical protein [Gammaproteobacteria bacterium]